MSAQPTRSHLAADPLTDPLTVRRHDRRPRNGWRATALLVGLGLVVAASACSSSKPAASGDAASAATAPTTASPTIAANTSTTAGSSSSVTSPPPPPATPITVPTSTDGTSPNGSGCSPATATTLPNGIWFGLLRTVDTSAGTIGLDLACWFGGEAANQAALADNPGAEVPVPNDYYIRNESPIIRTLHAVPNLAVVPLGTENGGFTGGSGPTQTGVAAASDILTSSSNLVWVQVTDGWVTVVQAEFTP